MKQRNHRRRGPYDPQTITKAVTHIRTQERPHKLRAPLFATPLSERWQRVAIQQAAGIAQSWRTNRAQAYQDYLDDLLDYLEQQIDGSLDEQAEEPTWREWDVPTLHQTCIQANVNVAVLEPAQDSTFD